MTLMSIEQQTRNEAAEYIERYAERLVAGPAVREHSGPINRNREEPDVAQVVRKHLRAVASGVRAGFSPESDWPLAGHSDGANTHVP